jgi:hypothetical protein
MKHVPKDTSRINLEEADEVDYWTQTLGVSRQQLWDLVKKHGFSAAAVRRALGKR